jgi:hypothetical protein
MGRAPAGLELVEADTADPVAAYFARAAQLEAASVVSFRRLADELAAHRAPKPLIAAAMRAARDERRHTRIMTALARRRGVEPPPFTVPPPSPRPLEALAEENAVQGCVGETWSAVLATWQSQHVADARLRGALDRIAADETNHAELGWAVARWSERRLAAPVRRQIDEARRAAVDVLEREASAEIAPALVSEAGWPTAPQARALFKAARRALWS